MILVKLPDGKLEGLSCVDKVAYAKFKSKLKNLEPGELCELAIKLPRNGKYHRKFFLMLTVGFDMWENGRKQKMYKGQPVTKNFETFREDILILAGHYEQTFGINGKLKLIAKSISFASMDQPEFEIIYNSVLDVLLEKVLITYKDRDEVNDVVERMMNFI